MVWHTFTPLWTQSWKPFSTHTHTSTRLSRCANFYLNLMSVEIKIFRSGFIDSSMKINYPAALCVCPCVCVWVWVYVPESTAITIISSCVLVALVAPQSPCDCVCMCECVIEFAFNKCTVVFFPYLSTALLHRRGIRDTFGQSYTSIESTEGCSKIITCHSCEQL